MVVRVVVIYSLLPALTWWTVGQGEDILYVGPEYIPLPFERWETVFVNITAGTFTFDIDFGGDTLNYGASFEIWYGALSSPSNHVLLAHGNHTRFVDEVQTNGEHIVTDFVIPEDNSGVIGMITASNEASTSTNTSSSTSSNSSSNPITIITTTDNSSASTLSVEYSATAPTYNCVCEDGFGCLQGLCYAADQRQDLCLDLACSWKA
jgi:Early growth response N-terminal domain